MSQDAKFLTLNRWGNPNAPYDIGNCVAFADAAGTAPVDGTGGSPSVTITRSTATPLDGVASFLFTKDAANRQGQGFSSDLVLQPDDATKMFTLSFDYQLTTGTYTGYQAPPLFSDLTMWVYDVTNSIMYQVMAYQIDGTISTTNQYSFQGQWQVPVGCLQARVIWFLGNTGTSAFTARFNNITFGRLQRQQGTIETPPAAYTPSAGGFGTLATVDTKYTRAGSVFSVNSNFTTGTVGASLAFIGLPSGVALDPSVYASGVIYKVGQWGRQAATEGNQGFVLVDGSSLGFGFLFGPALSMSAAGATSFTPQLANNVWANTQLTKFTAEVNILGWGANGTLGQDADTRVVAAKYAMGASYNFPKTLPFQFNTLAYDTHGAATYGAGVTFTYFVPVSGYYQIGMGVLTNNTETLGAGSDLWRCFAHLNGTSFIGNFVGGFQASGAGTWRIQATGIMSGAYFNAGDKIVLHGTTDGASYNTSANTTSNYVAINRISGPAQVQANENPTASYNTNAGQSIANASTVIIDFEDKIWDTFGMVTTGASWKFTSNRAGKVQVNCAIEYASAVFTNGTNPKLYVYKNGAAYKQLDDILIQAAVSITDTIRLGGSAMVDVLAGDTIDIRTSHGEAAGRSLTTTSNENYVDIAYIPGQ